MQTRSKSVVFKPKLFQSSFHQATATVTLALADPKWKQAMEEEYQALLRNHTWELISSSMAAHVVQCKWVCLTKFRADGSLDKYKARLVAKGFQQTPGIDFFETFSPVIKASTVRIIFTLAISRGWYIQQIDVNNAFLNGDLEEDVYISQPEGFVDARKPHHVCKLHKALYGLKQSPRASLDKLKGSFQNSVSDTSLFYTHKHGKILLLQVSVDGILITRSDSVDVQAGYQGS